MSSRDPVAGASSSNRSAGSSRSSCFTLPSTRMSRIPGIAVATTSSAPEETRRLEKRFIPWSARYSSRASSGVILRAKTSPPDSSRSDEHRSFVLERAVLPERQRQARLALELDHEHRQACVGRHQREGGADVVLPTPPLPATMRTRLCWQNRPRPWRGERICQATAA